MVFSKILRSPELVGNKIDKLTFGTSFLLPFTRATGSLLAVRNQHTSEPTEGYDIARASMHSGELKKRFRTVAVAGSSGTIFECFKGYINLLITLIFRNTYC